MATGNIDCNVSDGMHAFQPQILNIYNPSDITDCNRTEICLNMQPTVSSSVSNATFTETQAIEGLASQILNECTQHPAIDSNENCADTETILPISPDTRPVIQDVLVNDNENLDNGEFVKNVSHPSLQVQNVMPEELFINVESDDEGVHSWRPNISSDSLCNDFFMMPILFHDGMNLNLSASSPNQSAESTDRTQLINRTIEFQNSPLVIKPESSYQPLHPTANNLIIDFQSHVHSQMAGLNIVKYEIMNARRKANDLKEDIKQLAYKLNEKLTLQRNLDVEKLKEENSQLRLECQCLCMEVDYYLKGKAPLGEIDENFYVRKPPSGGEASQDQARSSICQQNNDIDNQEDHKKWDCRKCTFANHPAINSCEMCHTQRLNTEHPFFSAASPDSCYCHPKEDSS